MIADFETRLAATLGGRLGAPFTGRVAVEPGPGGGPTVLVSVQKADLIEPSLGEAREAVVPGATQPRRVVHARCAVRLQVIPSAGAGRVEQIQGLDAVLYALDAADFRSGSALAAPGDPGFLVREMRLSPALGPLVPGDAAAPLAVYLDVDGLFWPRGLAGEDGRAIAEVRVRGALLPVEILPANPRPIAGGAEVPLTVRVRTPVGETLPFGALALALEGPERQAPSGTFTGGGILRMVPLAGGTATIGYTPPAQPAVDTLVVALDNGAAGLGIELGRFTLIVRGA
jgi:hypothetical protein